MCINMKFIQIDRKTILHADGIVASIEGLSLFSALRACLLYKERKVGYFPISGYNLSSNECKNQP